MYGLVEHKMIKQFLIYYKNKKYLNSYTIFNNKKLILLIKNITKYIKIDKILNN